MCLQSPPDLTCANSPPRGLIPCIRIAPKCFRTTCTADSPPGCTTETTNTVDDENGNTDGRVLSLYKTDDVFSLAGMLDTVCLVAFCIELGLRAGVYSWWIGPDAVLRNPWVLLDVYLVVSHGVGTAGSVRGGYGTRNSREVEVLSPYLSREKQSSHSSHGMLPPGSATTRSWWRRALRVRRSSGR